MHTLVRMVPWFQALFMLALLAALIRRKRKGQWKRPWTFPVAMGLLSLALVLFATAQVLDHYGM